MEKITADKVKYVITQEKLRISNIKLNNNTTRDTNDISYDNQITEKKVLTDLYEKYSERASELTEHIKSKIDFDNKKIKLLRPAHEFKNKHLNEAKSNLTNALSEIENDLFGKTKNKLPENVNDSYKHTDQYSQIKTTLDNISKNVLKISKEKNQSVNVALTNFITTKNDNQQKLLEKLYNTNVKGKPSTGQYLQIKTALSNIAKQDPSKSKHLEIIGKHQKALAQNSYNFFKNNLFHVEFLNLPTGNGNNKIFTQFPLPEVLLAKNVEFAHDNLIENKTKHSLHNYSIAINRSLSNSLVLTFYDDDKGLVRNFFATWINTIIPNQTHIPFLNEYSAEIKVHKMNNKYISIEQYEFMHAFPTGIGPIQLSASSNGTIMEVAVTFVFKEYKTTHLGENT